MASAEHLKALLRSHLEGDNDRFISIAMQVAAHEARLGHGKLATDLRDIIDQAKKPPWGGISGTDRPSRAESWPTSWRLPTPRHGWGT